MVSRLWRIVAAAARGQPGDEDGRRMAVRGHLRGHHQGAVGGGRFVA